MRLVAAPTCQFLVNFKECRQPATHYRRVTTLTMSKGQRHEFKIPQEHYCPRHYALAAKWNNHDSTQFQYEMGELPPNEKDQRPLVGRASNLQKSE